MLIRGQQHIQIVGGGRGQIGSLPVRAVVAQRSGVVEGREAGRVDLAELAAMVGVGQAVQDHHLDHLLYRVEPVPSDGADVVGRDGYVHRDVREALTRVGDDMGGRLGVGDRHDRLEWGCFTRGHRTEILRHEILKIFHTQIPDRDDSHVRRHVPCFVERSEIVGGHRFDAGDGAERVSSLIGRSLGVDTIQFRCHISVAGFSTAAHFVEHHSTFGDHRVRIESGCVGHLGQSTEHRRDVGRWGGVHAHFENGLVVAHMGVEVRSELHTDLPHRRAQRVARVAGGAVEQHVLYEMSDACSCVGLVHRPDLHDEAQIQVVARIVVGAQIVGEAVV